MGYHFCGTSALYREYRYAAYGLFMDGRIGEFFPEDGLAARTRPCRQHHTISLIFFFFLLEEGEREER